MKPGRVHEDPALRATSMHILSNILSRADKPSEMATYLAEETRGLTGARCVVFIQCMSAVDEAVHRVVGVSPETQRGWAESPVADHLYDIVHHVSGTHLWRTDEATEVAKLLSEERYGLSLTCPLDVGSYRVGAMLVLGLPDEQRAASVLELLSTSSGVVALALRNAFLYERQEQIIQERTDESQTANEALRAGEARLVHLNRELRAISDCNQVLLRADDEQALLNEICRIICDEAGYRLAWVGYAENDDAKTVRPVAWAGIEDGYLDQARLTWADTERGRGPSGTAIRSGESVCIRDFATDPKAEPWRDSALERGYRSSISVPLKDENANTFGGLNIYSAEANAFTPDEMRLMEELAGDLAFGITALRVHAARQQVEEALRRSENDLKKAQCLAKIGSWDWDAATDTITWSEEYYRIYGFDPTQRPPGYVDHLKAYTPESAARLDAAVKRNMETGEPYELDLECARAEGQHAWITARSETKRDAQGNITGLRGTAQDITERKQAEQERLAHLRFFESMDRVNRAIQRADDLDSMMSDVLDVVLSIFDCDRAFLMYPCDPGAASWRSPMERNRPEYPGVLALGLEMPMDAEVAETLRVLLDADGPVKFGPGTPRPLPAEVSERFGFKSFMSMALYPKVDAPWQFGIHQCSYPRAWTPQEERLFQEIGRRLADALTNLLTYRDLRESEARLAEAQRIAKIGNWESDVPSGKLWWSDETYRIFGVDPEKVGATFEAFIDAVHPDDRERVQASIREALQYDSGGWEIDYRIARADGTIRFVQEDAETVFDQNSRPLRRVGTVQDITDRKRAEDIRRARLGLLEFAESHSVDELLTATLDQIERLTGSTIGFYHFLESDQETLSLHNWSANTLQTMCSATGKGSHYGVAEAGVWVDCVHERRPVIHNDYASLPHRKGMPEGHAPVVRELVVPVFRGSLIRAIVGVGNKLTNYAESDIEIASQLADLSWDIVERKRVEDEIRRTSEQWQATFDSISDLVSIQDAEFNLIRVNAAYARTFGMTPEALVGKKCYEIVHLTTCPLPECPHQQTLMTGESVVEEIWEPRLGAFFEVSTSPIFDATHKLMGSVHIAKDITERRRAEETQRHSEEEKSTLSGIANVFLTVPDEEMYEEILKIVLRVVGSPLGLFGYIGENGDLVIPSLSRSVWHECQVPGKSIVFPPASWGDTAWGKAIRDKKTYRADGPFHTPEGHIVIDCFLTTPIVFAQETIGVISLANKDGGYTNGDKSLLERIAGYMSPILNARLQRDRHERSRLVAENALRESEEKYRLLVENADEAIFVIDEGAIAFPNRKALELSGYSSSELASMSIGELIFADDRAAALGRYQERLEGKKPAGVFPFRIVNKRGEVLWVQLASAQITWAGRPALLCFLKDITEQKVLEAQFLQAQKMEAVGRLAGGVAHDFNNMIGAIQGYCELILAELWDRDPVRPDVVQIKECAERSAVLTRQLLAFSRRQVLAPEVFDLNHVLRGFQSVMARLIGEDVDLRIVPGASLGVVKADRGQIEQVVMNLAVNARDAMPGGGKLTIETANAQLDEEYASTHVDVVPGQYVMLAVSDTGHGIDKDTMNRVFEPFFTTKEAGKGTGLGLATVYGIVRQSGGSIWVYSEVGKGTTFKVYLPRVDEVTSEKATIRPATERGAGETILVVEDEDALRRLIARILQRAKYRVIEAANGGEAIVLCERYQGSIDLLITDVVMPEMGGRELVDRLIQMCPPMKILYMSGYTDNALLSNGILEEGTEFMQKPFATSGLLAKVREVLDRDRQA